MGHLVSSPVADLVACGRRWSRPCTDVYGYSRAAAFIAIAAPKASAALCAPGTFNDYVGLGATGCEIAGTLFSDFSLVAGPNFATPIDPNAIQLAPVASATDVGLQFTFTPALSALAGDLIDSLFGFRVGAGAGASLTGSQSEFGGAAATGDGLVTLIQDMCFDGAFATPPSGCSTTAAALVLFAIEIDTLSSDSLPFQTSAQFVNVVADFGVDGGLSGTADLGSATLRFATTPAATVPEPATLALVAFALLLLGMLPRARPLPTRR